MPCLSVGTNHRHIKAAEEETASSTWERYAEIKSAKLPKSEAGPVYFELFGDLSLRARSKGEFSPRVALVESLS